MKLRRDRIRKAEVKPVAQFRQQAVVVEFVHDQLGDLQYRTADGDRFRQKVESAHSRL